MATASTVDADFGTSAHAPESKKSGDRIQCVVVTPERTLFDEAVEFVAIPLFDGEVGILPGRSPLIGRLGYGELRTRALGSTKRYFVDGGFAQVRDDVVTILTNRAIPAASIDVAAAQRELAEATALHGTTELEQTQRARAIDRARGLIRVAGHAGKA
ncbi:ATP synthase F1 subunit epsilon [Tundrisphaera sp. TA3]|uniref:ATP synthase F1 subunit epsilon n=1 Tax=Tundrisphaera sp. TA3 TaxID=3435775 RepID=UPI003EBC10D2